MDLRAASLWEPEHVHVFPDCESAQQQDGVGGILPGLRTNLIDLQARDHISWDTKEWIVAKGATMVSLLGPDQSFTEIPAAAFKDLVKDQRLQVSQNPLNHHTGGIRAQIATASKADLEIANRRSCVIRSYLLGHHQPEIPDRTLCLWAHRFREAEQVYGDGYLGLIPRTRNRGNRQARIADKPRALMAQFIEKDYETLKQKSKYASWMALKLGCEREGLVAPSYRAFLRSLKFKASQPIYPNATSQGATRRLPT